jgi:GIY-YIG catalytic domain
MTCGVYAVVNKEMGWVSYIGASHHIEKRWRHVFSALKKGIYGGHLQKSYDLWGEKAVELEILEETEPEKRFERESYYLELYKPERGQKNPRRTATAASLSITGKVGRKMTEEQRQKILASNQKRKGERRSDQSRKMQREAALAREIKKKEL